MKCSTRRTSTPDIPLRVFIVEDSSMVRERLEEMLSSIEGLCSAGYATTADEAIRDILAAHPDVVVLDIRLAQGTGFDVLRALHERASDICVYMLSNFATPPYRRLAERLGAVEFFDKTNQIEAVREALAKRASRALN